MGRIAFLIFQQYYTITIMNYVIMQDLTKLYEKLSIYEVFI